MLLSEDLSLRRIFKTVNRTVFLVPVNFEADDEVILFRLVAQ